MSILSGAEYLATPFQTIHDRICDALRGRRPRLVAEILGTGREPRLIFENKVDDRATDDH
jgi:hypothetical protein